MSFWPFSRKRRRNSKSKADSPEKMKDDKNHVNATSVSSVPPASGGYDGQTPRRRLSKRIATTSGKDGSRRISGDRVAYATGSGHNTSEKQSVPGGSVEDITALPINRVPRTSSQYKSAGRASLEKPYKAYEQSSNTNMTVGERFPTLQRPQSLRSKRTAAESALPRRISSRRRKNDSIREEEIRAMSSPVPIPKRPASRGSDGLLRRESKKVRDGLNRRFERPESNISLPMTDTLQSTMYNHIEEHAFKVRNIFSPRPTIRYSATLNQHKMGSVGGTSAAESGAERRPRVSKEMLEESRTIDELADDLDAGGLKALMDRDQRRRDKKRVQDEERARRRLERKAEKQREEEQQRNAEYIALRKSKSREFIEGKQNITGLGLETTTTSEILPVPATVDQLGPVNTGTYLDYSKIPIPPDPYADSTVEPGSPQSGQRTPWDEQQTPFEEPIVDTARALRYSQASVSTPTSPVHHLRGPSNVSNLTDLRGEIVPEYPDIPDKSPKRGGNVPIQEIATQSPEETRPTERRGSDPSSRRTSAWAAFFRRGATTMRGSQDQGRPSPSQVSFSNTSRESMSRQLPPAHLQQRPSVPSSRSGTGTPNRTQSKFREDLPELPLAPPDPMAQATEVPVPEPKPLSRHRDNIPSLKVATGGRSLAVMGSFEDPLMKRADSPLNFDARDSAMLSQSLASVDSEGSWLTGRPSKRTSEQPLNQTPPMPSIPFDHQPPPPELWPVEDIRFGPLYAPRSEITGLPQHESEDVGVESEPGSDAEELLEEEQSPAEHTVVHGGVSRTPTVVRREAHLKSKEGLLNDLQAEDESQYSSSPHEEVAERTPFGEDGPAQYFPGRAPELPIEQVSEQPYQRSDEQSPVQYSESDHSSEQSPVQSPLEVKRAGSVNLATHHARAMSAGSAKLLDIPARAGSVGKRSPVATPDLRDGINKRTSLALSEPA